MIDTMIFGKLKKLRINPSPVADDTVFMRRAYLDLIGLLPTENEAREFVTDTDPAKRKKLVNRLMERDEFAEFWALKWADLLNVEVRTLDPKGVQLLHGWIRDRIADNTPMDEFARSIISARGSTYTKPAANYFFERSASRRNWLRPQRRFSSGDGCNARSATITLSIAGRRATTTTGPVRSQKLTTRC
ncbi:MAG TPA: hypothetical protein DGJ56_04500 [Verrucomicrobiales bacterium]|nr:hypothetical protein [Verrucomicrobiales bacterium]